jgi:uridine monophosphate synthetase
VKWAEVTTAHIFPGLSIVAALKEVAASAVTTFNTRVHTEISAGSPIDEEEQSASPFHPMKLM